MMLTRLSSFQLENLAIKLLIRCYRASMTQQTISLMDKSLILRLNCKCSGTPNCNLLVGESPPAVGKTPMGKTPVGKTPMGKTPVGKTPRSISSDSRCWQGLNLTEDGVHSDRHCQLGVSDAIGDSLNTNERSIVPQ